jgi:hypothetical protein
MEPKSPLSAYELGNMIRKNTSKTIKPETQRYMENFYGIIRSMEMPKEYTIPTPSSWTGMNSD